MKHATPENVFWKLLCLQAAFLHSLGSTFSLELGAEDRFRDQYASSNFVAGASGASDRERRFDAAIWRAGLATDGEKSLAAGMDRAADGDDRFASPASAHKREDLFQRSVGTARSSARDSGTPQGGSGGSSGGGSGGSGSEGSGDQNGFCNGVPSAMHMRGFASIFAPDHASRPCMVFLLPSLVMDTRWKFLLGCFATVLLGLMTERLLSFQHRSPKIADLWCVRLPLYAATLAAGYFLMLIVMCYSVELLVAVVGGLCLGRYCFGMPLQKPLSECCASP